MSKRILVDLSATIIHHGHVRLLKKASQYGKVIVALTSDNEIKIHKGYKPEIQFNHRKEILQSIIYVDEVIESPWLINDEFLDNNSIDFLVHGSDNSNPIKKNRLLLFPRTRGISSTKIRSLVLKSVADKIISDK